ncbi:MAG: L-seryl-tRNA(Sec) selenium transferase [Candidatus Zixiibacteriota bacterium]|nr:MAG: L-seryl-tRNA(Sec) selenium transferase [candidate division Zixibacteria bacterium]
MADQHPLRQQLLARLPGMPALLNHPEVKALREAHPTLFVNDLVRRELEAMRQAILEAPEERLAGMDVDLERLALRAADLARRAVAPSLGRAVNAAGVILHTALGRAPLAAAAREAVNLALQGYTTLAINRDTGRRGDRHLHTDRLLAHLTGAEAGIVVNNNAAATMLILNTLAAGREVIVSRGQLVEIGGAFRIPDVMARSGCKLVEVGTTNRTHLHDYENAITENTALLLRVHTSNYRMIGFTGEVPLADLAELGRRRGLPVMDDLGSGALVDLSAWGLPKEPLVQESVRDGADVVCFSGDKMLGGPQGGIIVGKRALIERIKKNPLTRALRCDKMTYSALEATLKLYLDPEKLPQVHPVLRMITEEPASVRRRAQTLKRLAAPGCAGRADLAVTPGETEMGSGSLPGKVIPSYVVQVRPRTLSPDDLGQRLRRGDPPVFSRIEDEAVVLDLRTVFPGEERVLAACLAAALG